MIGSGLAAIFLVGLLGGVHCAGMCGGLASAFSLQLPGRGPRFGLQLAYNLGRIASYGAAGALAGALGQGGLLLGGVVPVQHVLFVFANLMLIALGLYMAGVWQGVARLEAAGAVLWRRVQPLTGRLLPVTSLPRAFALGALWGWLPCGLVYSVLFSALMSGSAVTGALIMLIFGLGTLPNLLAMGLAAGKLRAWQQKTRVRVAAGVVVAAFGVLGLIRFGSLPAFLGDFCRV